MPQTASNASADSAPPVTTPPEVLIANYSTVDGALQKMLENVRNMRDTNHDEYDGMTHIEQCHSEEKTANRFIAPKVNPENTIF